MKKKVLIITILFVVIGLTQLYAQKGNSTDSKSYQGWTESLYWAPVYSGDQIIDCLSGTVAVHFVSHFKNGSLMFENDQIKGEVTSVSGEVFELKELDRYNCADGLSFAWKFNLMGNWGTHYIGTLTYNMLTGVVMDERAVAP